MRLQRFLILIFIALALCLGFVYLVLPSCFDHYAVCIGDPTMQSLAPMKYRILQPAIETLLAPNAVPFSDSILWIDTLLHMAIISLTIPLLYTWLSRNSDPDRAVIGVALFAVVYLMAYHYYFRALSTSLEVLFVCASLVFIERRWLWIAVVVILASLNRETGLVIVAIYAAYHGYKGLKPSLVLLAVYVTVTAGVHVALGSSEHMLGLAGTLTYNIANLADGISSNLLLLPLVVAVGLGYRTAPALLRHLCWVAVVYAVAIAVGGAWNETQRLVLPLMPLVIPTILANSCVQ